MTPSPSTSSSYFGSSNTYNNPPNDYVCKLCNRDGHWMKDCRLYEPRSFGGGGSNSSFKSTASSLSSASSSSNLAFTSSNNYNNNNGGGGGGGSFSSGRTLLPPGNYVCRLCNVAGHWIDQCSKFQPKDSSSSSSLSSSSPSSSSSNVTLPPMLGPGPTPNYRPPAYLSKPVPSNYLCNLCNRPGHWIQQCTEFTPIINKRPPQ